MKTFFCYGTNPKFPFRNGWTEVEAPDKGTAIEVFRLLHPDRTPGIVNCSFIYSEEEFEESGLSTNPLFLKDPDQYCHERVTFTRELYD